MLFRSTPGHAILEMPTGIGKTVCILSLIISYMIYTEYKYKLIYCTRTVVEMDKTVKELKNLVLYINKVNHSKCNVNFIRFLQSVYLPEGICVFKLTLKI